MINMGWERIKLNFTGNLKVRFSGRSRALKRIEEYAERGTYPVIVIYGPEGCGKTALFKQAIEVFRAYDYAVVHINPLAESKEEKLVTSKEVKQLLMEISEPFEPPIKLISIAVEILYKVVKRGLRRRIALLADDVFQAIGLNHAETLVKKLLNMIEYPSINYEKIAILVASSEGASRERIGRHRWASIKALWNIDKEGFHELYNQIPGDKPDFNHIWKWTGGNPWLLARLYENKWSVESIVKELIRTRNIIKLIKTLTNNERKLLAEAINNPDTLWENLHQKEAQNLLNKLIEKNLIAEIWDRDPQVWIDTPPPEKDPNLGIGKYIAWQTPLHKKAVEKALELTPKLSIHEK